LEKISGKQLGLSANNRKTIFTTKDTKVTKENVRKINRLSPFVYPLALHHTCPTALHAGCAGGTVLAHGVSMPGFADIN
jgi:hypothetical protein